MISVYGKFVPLPMYCEILDREAEKDTLNELNFSVIPTGRVDTSRIDKDTIIYEVEKQFDDTEWSSRDTSKYLVCIGFFKNEPRILSVYHNDENNTQAEVKIKLIDFSVNSSNDPGYLLSDVDVRLRITFNEPINDFTDTATTGPDGVASFGRVASNSSVVYINSVANKNGIRYDIPLEDLKLKGMNVSDMPAGGFIISLRPYKWNGLAYSLFLSGGGIIPEEVNMSNFESGSDFEGKIGYKIGFNFNLTYFFQHDQWKINPQKWLFGLGSGLSLDYQETVVNSGGFNQVKYQFIDSSADTCLILFKGQVFSETYNMISLDVPLFMEFKKQTGEKFSFSVKAGVNMSLPLSTGNYEADGTFSRWGYYDDLNSLPITEDAIFNYFTDSIITLYRKYRIQSLIS